MEELIDRSTYLFTTHSGVSALTPDFRIHWRDMREPTVKGIALDCEEQRLLACGHSGVISIYDTNKIKNRAGESPLVSSIQSQLQGIWGVAWKDFQMAMGTFGGLVVWSDLRRA